MSRVSRLPLEGKRAGRRSQARAVNRWNHTISERRDGGDEAATGRWDARVPLLRLAAKRALDVVLSALVLALMSAVIGLVALAIAVESPGPVLYRAERVGRGGRGFRMLKFRKMHAYSRGLRLTTLDDARFTRVGAFLARSKLDELPQFVNVLRGEMSLIGPRPEDPGSSHSDEPTTTSSCACGRASRVSRSSRSPRRAESCRARIRSATTSSGSSPRNARSTGSTSARSACATDVRILLWTVVAILFRRDVAVNRSTGRMGLRRR